MRCISQGDPIRALQAREMIKIIERDNLVQHTQEVGDHVYASLKKIQGLEATAGKLTNLRGEG